MNVEYKDSMTDDEVFDSSESTVAIYNSIDKKVGSRIELSYECKKLIFDLLIKSDDTFFEVCDDLFMSGIIPLTNVEIICPMYDKVHCRFNVLIKENYKEIIQQANAGETKLPVIGYYRVEMLGAQMGIRIVYNNIDKGKTHIALEKYTVLKKTKQFSDMLKAAEKKNIDILTNAYLTGIEDFVVISLALLHPVIKNIFTKPIIETKLVDNKRPKKKDKKYKKQKLIYIKKYVINADVIEKTIERSPYTRHTLCWYVVGHWRTLKSGEKTFVKPHWRGVLRNNKSVDEPVRERKIDPEYINIDED